jgi:mono/diheme cytochrome c family protein
VLRAMRSAVIHRLLAFLLLSMLPAAAHPVEAAPIDHPYIFTFDQFHLPEDDDESLTQGGLLLLAETRCAACHSAPAAWAEKLRPASGPDLDDVGSRMSADALWLWLRSPQHRKRGTLMPGFIGSEEDGPEKAEALVQHLLTQKKPRTEVWPTGSAERGKQLYHSVGCVACHEPAVGHRPPSLPAAQDVEKPGNASVPIALADDYSMDALAAFLHDPLETRPSGRMPSHQLSLQEAADVAAYLHLDRKVEPVVERAMLQIPVQTPAVGAALFQSMRCVNCHDGGAPPTMAKPLLQLKVDATSSCMSSTRGAAENTPHYGFNALQQRALKLALQHLHTATPQDDPAERIRWTMLRMNCYACHDRDYKGGPEDARAAYFALGNMESLGDLARLPPSLDAAGARLSQGWLQSVLSGKAPKLRSYLQSRMPHFGDMQTLLRDVTEADKPQPDAPVAPHLGGEALVTEHCQRCHGALPILPLAQIVQRSSVSAFLHLLQTPEASGHGTVIPNHAPPAKLSQQQAEAIWTWLKR